MANLPTVWSNVLVAFSLTLGIATISAEGTNNSIQGSFLLAEAAIWSLALTLLSASALYVGGCMLGDYRDLEFDLKHRPSRPLPSKIISAKGVLGFALSLIGLAAFAGYSTPLVIRRLSPSEIATSSELSSSDHYSQCLNFPFFTISLLIVFVVTYALLHKKNRSLALLNMALCRTALIIMSASMAMIIHPHGLTQTKDTWISYGIMALCVGTYTYLLSSVAATESTPDKFNHRNRLGLMMVALPTSAIFIALLRTEDISNLSAYWPVTIASLMIYLLWTLGALSSLRRSKPEFVSKALAGFCLLDACFAALTCPSLAILCWILFGFALLLQKISPAT